MPACRTSLHLDRVERIPSPATYDPSAPCALLHARIFRDCVLCVVSASAGGGVATVDAVDAVGAGADVGAASAGAWC